MTALPLPASTRDLGPATEALFRAAFAEKALIPAQDAARLLGIDVKALRALTDALVIRAVGVGKLRRYAEADLRAYLTESPAAPCRSIKQPKAATGSTTSNIKVVAFTALQESKRAGRPKR